MLSISGNPKVVIAEVKCEMKIMLLTWFGTVSNLYQRVESVSISIVYKIETVVPSLTYRHLHEKSTVFSQDARAFPIPNIQNLKNFLHNEKGF